LYEYIRGEIVAKSPTHVILDAGGIGYRMSISANAYEKLPPRGQSATVLVHLHVREDVLCLYGFVTQEERELFGRLTDVSGVGPKGALALLSGATPERLLTAVEEGDLAFLKSVKGVGEKIAKRIITELRADYPQLEAVVLHRGPAAGPVGDAVQALMQLGAKQVEATRAVKLAIEKTGPDASVEELLREALRAR